MPRHSAIGNFFTGTFDIQLIRSRVDIVLLEVVLRFKMKFFGIAFYVMNERCFVKALDAVSLPAVVVAFTLILSTLTLSIYIHFPCNFLCVFDDFHQASLIKYILLVFPR